MLIPSIDIQGGRAVQLINGRTFALDGGDPLAVAERFSRYGELAVIDLDAAMGQGDNTQVVLELVRRYPCRVGGGLRQPDQARRMLDAGARRVIIGSQARPDFLRQLPLDRVMAALDTESGSLMVDGWRQPAAAGLEEQLRALAPYVSGFLCTQIEREGMQGGADLDRARRIKTVLEGLGFGGDLVVAGGLCEAAELAELDALGIDAQVGMALYAGRLNPADCISACMRSDRPDGLWPTVVADEYGRCLGLVYSSRESLAAACERGLGIYQSRSRGLWEKGAGSGNSQTLLRVAMDCDRDSLLFIVRQQGSGFCHRPGLRSCYDQGAGQLDGLAGLERTVLRRQLELATGQADPASYTARLFNEPGLLAAKLAEEADELAEAEEPLAVAEEAADLLYFCAVKLAQSGANLAMVEAVLNRRSLRLSRRPGNAKKAYTARGEEVWQNGLH